VGEIFALALALAAYARIEGPAQLWLAGHGAGTETPRRCAVGQARRLVLRAERGCAGALRPVSQSRFGEHRGVHLGDCRTPHRARRLGGVGRRCFSARPRSIPGWPSHRDAPEPGVVSHPR